MLASAHVTVSTGMSTRGVRFGGSGDEGGKVITHSRPSPHQAEVAKTSRHSVLEIEDEPTPEALRRILDQKHFDTAQARLHREALLIALSDRFFLSLKVVAWLALLACLVMLAAYIYLRPVSPEFELITAGFVSLSITPLTQAQMVAQQKSGNYFAAYFTFNASFSILFENPNKKVDMVVHQVNFQVFYNGFGLGSVKGRSFALGRRSTKTITLFVVQDMLKVPLNVYYTMLSSGSPRTTFGGDILIKATMSTVGGIQSPPFWARVRCEMVLKNYLVVDRYCKGCNA